MFLNWILPRKYRKSTSRGRNQGGQRRAGSRSRQLRLEPLEIRSLFGAAAGWHPVGAAAPPSLRGSLSPETSAVAQLVFIAPRSVQMGVPVTVQLAAVNARGRVVSTFSDSVAVTSSDTAAKLPGSISFVDGVAVFSVTFNTAGSQTLTATDSTNTAWWPRPRPT